MLRTLILILFSTGLLQAQLLCTMLSDLKSTTYDFSPATLTKLEKTAKVIGLDRFWELANHDKVQSLDCLMSLLKKERKDSFFLFDVSQLLWTIDKSDATAAVIADALALVNLGDVKPYDYVALAIDAARNNADISAAAMNFAHAANVSEYLPGGGTIMNREDGIVLLFGSQKEEIAVKKAIALHQSNDPKASPFALLSLALALTPEALAYLRKDGIALSAPALIQRQVSTLSNGIMRRGKEIGTMNRAQVLSLLQAAPKYPEGSSGPYGNDPFLSSAFAELGPEDAPLIREARRKSIVDPSPASLAQYYAYSQILQLVQTKAGMYRATPK